MIFADSTLQSWNQNDSKEEEEEKEEKGEKGEDDKNKEKSDLIKDIVSSNDVECLEKVETV